MTGRHREIRKARRTRMAWETAAAAYQPTQAERQAQALADYQASLGAVRAADQRQFDADGLPRFAYEAMA